VVICVDSKVIGSFQEGGQDRPPSQMFSEIDMALRHLMNSEK